MNPFLVEIKDSLKIDKVLEPLKDLKLLQLVGLIEELKLSDSKKQWSNLNKLFILLDNSPLLYEIPIRFFEFSLV